MTRAIKSVLAVLVAMLMVLSVTACNSNDKTDETKATTVATQAQTEKATDVQTDAEVETSANDTDVNSDTSDSNAETTTYIGDLTGIWKNVSYPDNVSITISEQNGNTIHMTITAIRGANAQQIATFEDDVMLAVEPTDSYPQGYADVDYEDSFGNTGRLQITATEGAIVLTVLEEETNGTWGISGAGGKFMLYEAL